jgi:hypothetical protein
MDTMNANSLRRAFTKRLHLFFVVTLIAALGIFASVGPVSASATISIVDTLGVATPATQFSVFGASGASVLGSQFVGPEFTLTQPTILTEIGGFVNNCDSIVEGVPLCPTTLPFTVQIRRSTNGVPDASTVLASFVLSHDNNPLIVSYESVAINLPLQPGSYFALFAPQGNDQGFLLGSASSPFNYQAGLIYMGFLDPSTGISSAPQQFGAVRILGETATVVIDGCNSGVTNSVLSSGGTISDLIAECAEGASNHGQFVSCVSHVTNDLKNAGTITGQQKGAIQRCAAQADIP